MRANIPTDNDFAATQPVTDDTPAQDKITKEQKDLAKIGNSPQWKLISKYIDARIDVYKNGLFGENLSGVDTTVIGQRFLAARSVIEEFESLKQQIDKNTEVVNEVFKEEKNVE